MFSGAIKATDREQKPITQQPEIYQDFKRQQGIRTSSDRGVRVSGYRDLCGSRYQDIRQDFAPVSLKHSAPRYSLICGFYLKPLLLIHQRCSLQLFCWYSGMFSLQYWCRGHDLWIILFGIQSRLICTRSMGSLHSV
ncbi:hypothetical protein ATANTOWER_008364 [Ataeniobius toweri]|uniref:Uncharacterized protein n=1 Tax=Ataeniobius toweri TaxID=208326 RepID=A0ABU7BPC7_9TELE|nr:hypothetical protein [Ataeniobius toweri]